MQKSCEYLARINLNIGKGAENPVLEIYSNSNIEELIHQVIRQHQLPGRVFSTIYTTIQKRLQIEHQKQSTERHENSSNQAAHGPQEGAAQNCQTGIPKQPEQAPSSYEPDNRSEASSSSNYRLWPTANEKIQSQANTSGNQGMKPLEKPQRMRFHSKENNNPNSNTNLNVVHSKSPSNIAVSHKKQLIAQNKKYSKSKQKSNIPTKHFDLMAIAMNKKKNLPKTLTNFQNKLNQDTVSLDKNLIIKEGTQTFTNKNSTQQISNLLTTTGNEYWKGRTESRKSNNPKLSQNKNSTQKFTNTNVNFSAKKCSQRDLQQKSQSFTQLKQKPNKGLSQNRQITRVKSELNVTTNKNINVDRLTPMKATQFIEQYPKTPTQSKTNVKVNTKSQSKRTPFRSGYSKSELNAGYGSIKKNEQRCDVSIRKTPKVGNQNKENWGYENNHKSRKSTRTPTKYHSSTLKGNDQQTQSKSLRTTKQLRNVNSLQTRDKNSYFRQLFNILTKNNQNNFGILSPQYINFKGLSKSELQTLQLFFEQLEEEEFEKMNVKLFISKIQKLDFVEKFQKDMCRKQKIKAAQNQGASCSQFDKMANNTRASQKHLMDKCLR